MSNAVDFLVWVFVEETTIVVLLPAVDVKWVVSNELDEAEAIISVVGAGCAVDDEGLVRVWVC